MSPCRYPTCWRWPPQLIAAAAFFGTGLGMSLQMAALAGGNVGVVSTLSSMTPTVTLPMVWARCNVRSGSAAWAGAALAVAGAGPEILVDRVKLQRKAEAHGDFAKVFGMINPG